jgi:hypothetical protein
LTIEEDDQERGRLERLFAISDNAIASGFDALPAAV